MSQPSLHQFFGGKEPPAKKSKLTDEEKKQNAKEYKLNQPKRKFCETWKEKRLRLKFDTDTATMKFQFCIESNVSKENLFVVGNNQLKLDLIKRHEETKDHNQSAKISLSKAQSERTRILMRNAHAIGKQARPLSDFKYLAKLDKAKGIDIGSKYLNDIGCKAFVE